MLSEQNPTSLLWMDSTLDAQREEWHKLSNIAYKSTLIKMPSKQADVLKLINCTLRVGEWEEFWQIHPNIKESGAQRCPVSSLLIRSGIQLAAVSVTRTIGCLVKLKSSTQQVSFSQSSHCNWRSSIVQQCHAAFFSLSHNSLCSRESPFPEQHEWVHVNTDLCTSDASRWATCLS